MKKTLSLILFIVTAAVLLIDICFCVYGMVDIYKTFSELAAKPGTSGVDYFGIGWSCGIGLFGISTFGLILGVINVRISESKIIRYSLFGIITLFALLFLTAIVLFYI